MTEYHNFSLSLLSLSLSLFYLIYTHNSPYPLDRVNNVNVSLAQPPASAIVRWDAISPFPPHPASEYQVVYRPVSSTIVQFKNVDRGESQTMLTGLQDSAMYEVYVRLVCGDNGGVGPLSDPGMNLTLVDASMFPL